MMEFNLPVRPLRILHIDTERTWRGGERQLILLAKEQGRRGHVPVIVGQPGCPLILEAADAGLEGRELAMRGEWDLWAAWRLVRFVRELNVDLLHLHTSHAHSLGLLASFLEPRPLVVHRRVDFPIGRTSFSRLKYGKRVHCFISVSHAVAEILRSGGVPSERVSVVHSAAALPEQSPPVQVAALRAELGLSSKDRVIGVVAHLADHKGHRSLIDAMPQVVQAFPEARLLLVGDGELRGQLEQQVARCGLGERVVFTGFRRDAVSIIRIFEVFVLPSHKEGLGSSLLDALLLKCPIVATTAGGIPEIMDQGLGSLVPPGDSAALAHAIIANLANPVGAQDKAERGFLKADCFGIESMTNKTELAYQTAWDVFSKCRLDGS